MPYAAEFSLSVGCGSFLHCLEKLLAGKKYYPCGNFNDGVPYKQNAEGCGIERQADNGVVKRDWF